MTRTNLYTANDLVGRTAKCSCGRLSSSATCVKADFVFNGRTPPGCLHCGFTVADHTEHRHAFPREKWAQYAPRIDRLYDGHAFEAAAETLDTFYCGHAGWD